MYRAARGGHAPGHLRDAFLEIAVPQHGYEVTWFQADRQAWWEQASDDERRRWLTGQLWNCSDCLPGDVCIDLKLPTGSTYARAARRLRTGVG